MASRQQAMSWQQLFEVIQQYVDWSAQAPQSLWLRGLAFAAAGLFFAGKAVHKRMGARTQRTGRHAAMAERLGEVVLSDSAQRTGSGTTMAERLGNVVYWACSGGAVLWAIFALYALSTATPPQWGPGLMLVAVISIPLWLVGKANRYVLAGR